MQTTHTTFTVAEYCDQFHAGTIRVDSTYQRTPSVWPPAARSFLIDTILSGYLLPKFTLYQRTDRDKKRTVKDIVDGQQRTQAIYDFWRDKLRITGRSAYSGLTYSQLDPEQQQQFLEYTLTVDLIIGATEEDLREIFLRINSYTAPVNPQEARHGGNQGAFKWFIYGLSKTHGGVLKQMGVFTQGQLSRMKDGELFTALCRAMTAGIETHSKARLDDMYKRRDAAFPEEADFAGRMTDLFATCVQLAPLHDGPVFKVGAFYSLALAILHHQKSVPTLQSIRPSPNAGIDVGASLRPLTLLAAALEDPDSYPLDKAFTDAAAEATNTKSNRSLRFSTFVDVLVRS